MGIPASKGLREHIRRTLLYYDIFRHPLTAHELFTLLSMNSLSREQFMGELDSLVEEGVVSFAKGYYSVLPGPAPADLRMEREQLAVRRIRIARFFARIIRMFPFVRGIFVSGDLSKGVAVPESDIDYMIVTAPGRLWICRTLLILFKKAFLLNKKKYFCLNYFISSDHLCLDDRTYYSATEVAHLKPLDNTGLYLRFMNANAWVRKFFPNYRVYALPQWKHTDRAKFFQKIPEAFFLLLPSDRLDRWLMERMNRLWTTRYPQYDTSTRERLFRCTPTESSAYAGNFSDKVLAIYAEKLARAGLSFGQPGLTAETGLK